MPQPTSPLEISERQIARALVEAALEAGCQLRIEDEESVVVNWSADADELMRQIDATEITWLRLRHSDSSDATFLLVWGNGDDLISNYSDNDLGRSVLDVAQRKRAALATAERAVNLALDVPRHATAADALAATANPYAGAIQALRQDGQPTPDIAVLGFEAVPAWATGDGRIVSLADAATEPNPPDLYAVRALTAHPDVATGPVVVEFHAQRADADAAAARFNGSLEAGMVLSADQLSARQWLDATLGQNGELLDTITARIAQAGDNLDLARPLDMIPDEVDPPSVPRWAALSISASSSAPVIRARFQPQAWVLGVSMEVDPEGETEFAVPLSSGLFLPDPQGDFPEDDGYGTDDLRTHEAAPAWVREWTGPFYVEVTNRDEIEAYFESEMSRISKIESIARGEPSQSAEEAQRQLAMMGSTEWAHMAPSAEPTPSLATVLTDRWMEPLDNLSPQDAALIVPALVAVENANRSGVQGASEMTFIAKTKEGQVGYLFEFEFDDNAAPDSPMIERFMAFAAQHAPGATAAYIEPDGSEVFNGRAAFQAFFPGTDFPAPQLDALAAYTLNERYRYPDPTAWQAYLADSTARLVNRWMHGDPAMDQALAALVREETYGIADSWASREQVESLAANPDLDPDTASILHLRAGLLGSTSDDAARADARWRNEIAQHIISYDPAADGRVIMAVSSLHDALFPEAEMQGWTLTGGANVVEEPVTGRAAMLWEIETNAEGGATLWVESHRNIPAPGVGIRGNFNAIMGDGLVLPGAVLDASRVSGFSEVRSGAHLTNARVHDTIVEQSSVRNTREARVIAKALIYGSSLTDSDTRGPASVGRILHNITASGTTFAGEVELHGGTYGQQIVAGNSKIYPIAAPEGPIMVLPKNDKFTLTGASEIVEREGRMHRLFEIEALRTIWPAKGERIEAGDKGGWIESPAALASGEPDVWTASEAWIGQNALVFAGSSVQENAFIVGEAQDGPAILDRSHLFGQARIEGRVELSETRVSGVSHVSGAWDIAHSRLDAVTFKSAPNSAPSRAVGVKAKHVTVDDGATLDDVEVSHVIFGGRITVEASIIESAFIRDTRLDHVEVGPVRFQGAAREIASRNAMQQVSSISNADLSGIRIAPDSTIRGTATETATLPVGVMFAGKYNLYSDEPSKRAIMLPMQDNMMFTGDWMTVQIPDWQGQEPVFEVMALRDLPGRAQPQVQLDGDGNRRGTIPAVTAGTIGGHVGRDVVIRPDALGAWIESGSVLTGRASLNDNAFVGGSSHVHDAELNGDSVVMDAVVMDADTVLGKVRFDSGARRVARDQAPVVIGVVLRHSILSDSASVVSPMRSPDEQRPVVNGVVLDGHASASVLHRVPAVRLKGRTPEEKQKVAKWRSLVRVIQQRNDGAAQNAERVRALPAIHERINERAALDARLAQVSEGGKIGVIREGMDCDATQYRRESIIDRPASLIAFIHEENEHEGWLDGPESTFYVSPSEVSDGYHASRDLALEAFEDGHPHVVYPVVLPRGADARSAPTDDGDGRRITGQGNATLAFRDMRPSISTDDLATALTAAQRMEESQQSDPVITRYLTGLNIRGEDDLRATLGRMRASDHWPGVIAQLQAFGGVVQIDQRSGSMTYRRDPAQELAARQQAHAERLEDDLGVTVSHYRALAHVTPEYSLEQPNGPFVGVLRHRGELPDAFRQATGRDLVEPVWLRFVGPASHDMPIYAVAHTTEGKPVLMHSNSAVQDRLRDPARFIQQPGPNPATRSAPSGPAPVLYNVERIDNGRVMVRFIAVTEPGDDQTMPRFQSAVVPDLGHVETAALRPPMPSIAAADSVARFMAERDPLFFSRKALAPELETPSDGPRPARDRFEPSMG